MSNNHLRQPWYIFNTMSNITITVRACAVIYISSWIQVISKRCRIGSEDASLLFLKLFGTQFYLYSVWVKLAGRVFESWQPVTANKLLDVWSHGPPDEIEALQLPKLTTFLLEKPGSVDVKVSIVSGHWRVKCLSFRILLDPRQWRSQLDNWGGGAYSYIRVLHY